MTLEEKNQCLEFVDKLEALNIEKIIIDQLGLDTSNLLINEEYKPEDFIIIIHKLIKNFKEELNSRAWASLSSYSEDDHNTYHLTDDLESLYKFLSQVKFTLHLSTLVSRLIIYQRRNNFWHRQPSATTEELEDIASELRLKKEIYISLTSEQLTKNTEIENRLNTISNSISEKTKDFQKLTDNLIESRDSAQKMREISIKGENEKEKLDEIIAAARKGSDEFGNRMEEERKKFDEYRKEKDAVLKELLEKIEEITGSQKRWDEKFSSIEEKEKYINNKKTEIDNLTSFAAGASLFHTFQERKKELHKSVNFWQYSVAAMAIIVLGILFFLFSVNPSTTENGTSWGIFALNSLKSLPVVILLYFAIRQYNKERSFQEEYAFKSSVALTINAYADKLTEKGTTGKDSLIIASVAKVYELPGTMKEKGTVISFRSKSLNETMKNLTEVLKEIKK